MAAGDGGGDARLPEAEAAAEAEAGAELEMT